MTNQHYGKFQDNYYSKKIAIIGGGLAGITTAIFLAKKGNDVVVIEKSSELGGRARTSNEGGFYFNQGPHALYSAGAGKKILEELGVKFEGKKVLVDRYFALLKDEKYIIPISLKQILTTKLLKGIKSKLEAIRFFALLNKINLDEIEGISLQNWLDMNIRNDDVKDLLKLFFRISTYANDAEIQSAGSTLRQLKVASKGGVIYIDGGWQILVEGLAAIAKETNVEILTGTRVTKLEGDNYQTESNSKWILHLSNGNKLYSDVLVMATGPLDVYNMLKSNKEFNIDYITKLNERLRPVRAATLDIALSILPNPNIYGVYGIDKPLYASLHSAFAKLAPNGGVLFHLMKYLGASTEPNPKEDRKDLEDLMDMIQPGWRKVVVKERFLPNMLVSNGLITSQYGGIKGRPDVKVEGIQNLYIVGDWVGPEGLLADASLSSAKRAAEKIMEQQNQVFTKRNYASSGCDWLTYNLTSPS